MVLTLRVFLYMTEYPGGMNPYNIFIWEIQSFAHEIDYVYLMQMTWQFHCGRRDCHMYRESLSLYDSDRLQHSPRSVWCDGPLGIYHRIWRSSRESSGLRKIQLRLSCLAAFARLGDYVDWEGKSEGYIYAYFGGHILRNPAMISSCPRTLSNNSRQQFVRHICPWDFIQGIVSSKYVQEICPNNMSK